MFNRLGGVPSFADDLNAGVVFEDAAQPLPEQRVCVSDEAANCHKAQSGGQFLIGWSNDDRDIGESAKTYLRHPTTRPRLGNPTRALDEAPTSGVCLRNRLQSEKC